MLLQLLSNKNKGTCLCSPCGQGMSARAIYSAGDTETEFRGGVVPPVDTSRDASAPIDPKDPLYQVRTDIESIQFQINTFLTKRMEEQQTKKPKRE